MSQYETRRIRVGGHVALLRAEVGPAGVGRTEVLWEGAAPGRLKPDQWERLRKAKARWIARLAGTFGAREG